MAAEHGQRTAYAALAVLFGVPCVLAGGLFSVLLITELPSDPRGGLWGLAGVIGLLAWLWLSTLYLWKGREGLRLTHRPRLARALWVGMALGVLATLPLFWIMGSLLADTLPRPGSNDLRTLLALFVFGPTLLVPTAMLAWLARR